MHFPWLTPPLPLFLSPFSLSFSVMWHISCCRISIYCLSQPDGNLNNVLSPPEPDASFISNCHVCRSCDAKIYLFPHLRQVSQQTRALNVLSVPFYIVSTTLSLFLSIFLLLSRRKFLLPFKPTLPPSVLSSIFYHCKLLNKKGYTNSVLCKCMKQAVGEVADPTKSICIVYSLEGSLV